MPSSPTPSAEPALLTLLCRVLDVLPTPALLLDPAGAVLHANAAESARSGRLTSELLGRDLFRELAPQLEESGVGVRFRAGVWDDALSLEVHTRLGHAAGAAGAQPVCLRLRALGAGGQRWGIASVEDRSEIEQAEQRRKSAERLAAVGELAAGVAHEVNNPLASIKSFAQLLARDSESEEQRHALEIIIHESTRVASIVESMLSFARQQGAGGRERVNLNTITERVLSLQQYALQTAGIEVRRDFDAGLSPVMGEPGALEQVVLNLIVNAEQALSARSTERRLIVRTRESSEGVILSVVDNGPGIPRALLSEIFDAFRTTKAEGSGLGLGISQAIVRDHSGQIWAESEEDRGAAFFVRLPRAAATGAEVVAPAAPQPAARAPLAAVELEPPSAPLRVLVADDEPSLRMVISVFLSRRGHQVTQASDAYEALRFAGEQEFDVALVDARMPGDGLALLEYLESLPQLRGRTALMTGDLGRARTTQGIATGRPYLTKPFDMDEMVRLIETLGRA
jgi:signal transduction histidine kinase